MCGGISLRTEIATSSISHAASVIPILPSIEMCIQKRTIQSFNGSFLLTRIGTLLTRHLVPLHFGINIKGQKT